MRVRSDEPSTLEAGDYKTAIALFEQSIQVEDREDAHLGLATPYPRRATKPARRSLRRRCRLEALSPDRRAGGRFEEVRSREGLRRRSLRARRPP
jgi:hypothetical protein